MAESRARGVARIAALVAWSSGCGRIDFDVVELDGATIDGSATDATPVACELAWTTAPTLSPPVLLTSLNAPGSEEVGAFLATDGVTLYFSSDRGAGADRDIFVAQRPSEASAFGMPALVGEANTGAGELQLTTSADGLEAFLNSDRTGNPDIFVATRASTSDPFGAFSLDATLSSPVPDYNAVLSSDDRRLYFAAVGRAGGAGMTDLWTATRPGRGSPFAAPTPLAELNTAGEEASPTVIESERVIVFTAIRGGNVDLWFATRSAASDPFGPPSLVPGLATIDYEWQAFLRRDGCELFFTSDRSGDQEMYVSRIVLP